MKKITLRISIFVGIILSLALWGRMWSMEGGGVKAQTVPTIPTSTIPTAQPPGPPTDKPIPTAGPPKISCIFGQIDPKTKLDLFVPLKNSKKDIWGGVFNPVGSACSPAIEKLCVIPVNMLTARAQLRYHREVIWVRQFVDGKLDNTVSCGDKTVYYDLTKPERIIYDKDNSRIGIYWLDMATKKWVQCSNQSFDSKVGPNGRVSCKTTDWGYFALAWPTKK
jgi:hypothetical protein